MEEVTTAVARVVQASTTKDSMAAEHPTYAKAAMRCAIAFWLPAAAVVPVGDITTAAHGGAGGGRPAGAEAAVTPATPEAARVARRAKVAWPAQAAEAESTLDNPGLTERSEAAAMAARQAHWDQAATMMAKRRRRGGGRGGGGGGSSYIESNAHKVSNKQGVRSRNGLVRYKLVMPGREMA